jgi:hypothetical protein
MVWNVDTGLCHFDRSCQNVTFYDHTFDLQKVVKWSLSNWCISWRRIRHSQQLPEIAQSAHIGYATRVHDRCSQYGAIYLLWRWSIPVSWSVVDSCSHMSFWCVILWQEMGPFWIQFWTMFWHIRSYFSWHRLVMNSEFDRYFGVYFRPYIWHLKWHPR